MVSEDIGAIPLANIRNPANSCTKILLSADIRVTAEMLTLADSFIKLKVHNLNLRVFSTGRRIFPPFKTQQELVNKEEEGKTKTKMKIKLSFFLVMQLEF